MVDSYAQRVLNPFRGVMQVVRHQAAEAVSMDGVHWDIYVSNDTLLAGTEGASGPVQVSEARFGRWSAGTGLARGPLHPSEDFYRMERMGMVLYEHLRRLHEQVPFPFRDRYERWLLTRTGEPLVLLDSSVGRPAARSNTGEFEWRIGLAAQAQFASPAVPEAIDNGGRYLMDYVNGMAGCAAWYHREPDGSGQALDEVAGAAARLPAAAFPALLLRRTGHDLGHGRLIDDFIAWQAPWLLLLDGLAHEVRADLERQARRRAAEVAKLYRLYPAQADAEQIQAARIEARLQASHSEPGSACNDDLSTFYIELNPGGDD
ncbi:hypothetical protein EZJ19_05510 [Parasulfuritortus cantonensis]|uniref:Uncharacterized protein n=1 Tax=Parasulfuritortus cantonensis TaxID=2528202 RepID=A0A4R1BGR8_9PROT|nr:hypothetical protein [Parasulfuritortus cantonensis]TCJ16357.1 hypothetical protein EZJ19_05510 [Parasulfuritortus cantonensis]